MKFELPHNEDEREAILNLPFEERIEYIPLAFDELLMNRYTLLKKWRDVTSVTAQPDSGYNAERLVALFSGKEGTRNRGSGSPDLSDGSEVKAVWTIDADDRPRWNHHFTPSSTRSQSEKVEDWLQNPAIFYVAIDDMSDHDVRFRIWKVNPSEDDNYQRVLRRWVDESGNNFQLHPFRYPDSDVATNDCGDLRLPLAFEMVFEGGEATIPTAEANPGESGVASDLSNHTS